MKGNFQVRFLGEGAVVIPLPYPTPQGSVAAEAGSGSQGRQAGTVGTARNRPLPALGLAQECVPSISRSARASFTGCQCADSGHQRRLYLRRQTVLPRNDELRGGEVLPQYLRCPVPGWQPRRRTVREAVSVVTP